jgi:hypothetical protein
MSLARWTAAHVAGRALKIANSISVYSQHPQAAALMEIRFSVQLIRNAIRLVIALLVPICLS